MITPRAPKPPLVGRLLRGISKSPNLEKTYEIFSKMFKPHRKFLKSPDK